MRTFRSVLLAVGFLVGCLSVFGQEGLISPTYGWKAYVSQMAPVEITDRDGVIYCITAGGLFTLDMETEETEQFTTVEGLSSIDPTTVFRDPESNLIFIGHRNGMINVLDSANNIKVISDIFRSDQFTTKAINRFAAWEGLVYTATEFGIVVYDPLREETRMSITKIADNATGTPVRDLTIAEGRLWAAMGGFGVWSVNLSDPNITLPWAWEKESGTERLPNESCSYICSTGDILFALIGDTILKKNPGQDWVHSPFDTLKWTYLNAENDRVYAVKKQFQAVLYPDSNYVRVSHGRHAECVHVVGGTFFIGDRKEGLFRWTLGTAFEPVAPFGPTNNFVADLVANNGELYVAPAGLEPPIDRQYDKSGIPYFNFHDGGWKVSDYRNGALSVDDVYMDFARTAYDPATRRCYMGSWGDGIVVLENGVPIESYTAQNSGLTAFSGQTRVSGLAVDEFGNLWVSMVYNDYPLNVRTPDGQWHAISPTTGFTPYGFIIDDYNNKWINNLGAGIVVYNDNYTPGDPSDDRSMAITTQFGQGALPTNSVLSIAQDHDEQIWIGTTEGVTIIYDPSITWTTEFQDAACPIIDGFCLLRDQQVNDIAVDGANRKWLATENGLYQVNVDGTELLKHFTTDNSPLFDNDVKSLAIDPTTGEIFIGTAKGLISYMGDAIEGHEDAAQLYVYPNPVPDDYDGPVMIKGMKDFSKVKIATASGRVVRELDSFGGEVPWDRMDTYGNRVRPGIYLVMVANDNGEGAGITKVAILERQGQ